MSELVRSVHRALKLLEALDSGASSGVSLASASAATGMKPPTAHNLLSTLVHLGYAEQDEESRHYRLGSRALALGTGKALLARIGHVGREPVEQLARATGETVVLAVDWDDRRHSVLCVESRQALSVRADPGVDEHFYDTATGRVLLSLRSAAEITGFVRRHGLPGTAWPEAASPECLRLCVQRIRERGEVVLVKSGSHIRALAVPVVLPGEEVRVSLGLFYPTVRDAAGRTECLLEHVRDTAAAIASAFERM